MAWYWAKMAKMMGVGPAGRKSKTPRVRGRRRTVRRMGGMMEVRRAETRMNDCEQVSQ